MSVYRTQLKLEMEIEGVGERLPLSAAVVNYALNQLPSATCTLAIGRNAYTGKVAHIHSIVQKVTRLAKAKVWMQAFGQYDAKYKWPGREVMIFEGRIVGPGQVVGADAGYTLSLVHWLADLHYSSMLSSRLHPGNPADMTWRAVDGYVAAGNQLIPSNRTMQTTSQMGGSRIDEGKMAGDLWGQGLKSMLCGIARQEHIKMGSVGNACEAVKRGNNTQALDALTRMDGDSTDCGRKYSDYAPKLAIDATVAPSKVTSALLQFFMGEGIQSSISQTFWSKLVHSYAANLMCAIVPLADHALFTSVTPGLRKTYCKEITADDYENGRFVFPVNEPLRAVGIISENTLKCASVDTTNSANRARPNAPVVNGVGGCYAPADAHELGTIRMFRPPLWLNNIQSCDFSVTRTTGFDAVTAPSSAFTPQATVKPDIKGDGTNESSASDQTLEMFRSYARVLFVTNSLRGRAGSIVGKLRFDIAPGSNVKIHAKYEPFVGTGDKLVSELVGTVAKVTCVLDAEAKEAVTTFEFAYLRTVEENKLDSYSLPGHPLFKEAFVGCPLVDELQFGKCK